MSECQWTAAPEKVNQNKAVILPPNKISPSMETVPVKSQQQKGSSHFALNLYSLDIYIQATYLWFSLYSEEQVINLWGTYPIEGVQGTS